MIIPVAYQRDPVSELMDAGAARLLRRAYARPGQWAGTSLAHPTAAHLAWARREGINMTGADPTAGDRWMRGFIRSLYYTHRWYYRPGQGLGEKRVTPGESKALVYQVGRVRLDHRPGRGVTIRGRSIRIRVLPGGQAAWDAIPADQRYTGNDDLKSPFVIDRDWTQA
jgi:hypothetical protein